METVKRELYEVFSVQYGNGKSKGWKVQGSEKVHTAKTKTAAYSLADQMKSEAKHVTVTEDETSKSYKNLDVELTTKDLQGLKPMKRYYYLMGHQKTCPVCNKEKNLRTFADKKTWEIAETCHSCQNVVKRAQAKVEQQEMVEEVVHKVLETSEVLKAIEPLEKA